MIYAYLCPTCEAIKEDVVHGMNEKPEIKCEKCGAKMNIKFAATAHIRGKSQSSGISGTGQDILRHQAKILSETQGGL